MIFCRQLARQVGACSLIPWRTRWTSRSIACSQRGLRASNRSYKSSLGRCTYKQACRVVRSRGHLQSTLSRGVKIVSILVWCLCSRALPTNKQSSHQGPRPAREITGEAATQDVDYSSLDMQAKPINLYMPHVHMRRHTSQIRIRRQDLHQRFHALTSKQQTYGCKFACKHAYTAYGNNFLGHSFVLLGSNSKHGSLSHTRNKASC